MNYHALLNFFIKFKRIFENSISMLRIEERCILKNFDYQRFSFILKWDKDILIKYWNSIFSQKIINGYGKLAILI